MDGTTIIRDAISRAGGQCTAVIEERAGVWDIAAKSLSGDAVVVRCVKRVRTEDCFQLRTMLFDGDFTQAVIVYTEESEPPLLGPIPIYPLSRVTELAAALAMDCVP